MSRDSWRIPAASRSPYGNPYYSPLGLSGDNRAYGADAAHRRPSFVQTTVPGLAQLSTSAGLRAPLAHTANQVFLDLVRELKEQGLGNKVIADMFGLALSTYHDKVRRMSESQSYRGRSLWEATFSFVQEREALLQTDVLTRFRNDDEANVRAVLNDLVESGLVFRSERAEATNACAPPDRRRCRSPANRLMTE